MYDEECLLLIIARTQIMLRVIGFQKRNLARVISQRTYAPPLGRSFAVATKGVTVETNLKTETNRLEKTLQKFWEKITVENDGAEISVKMDGKCLRTPLGNEIILPKSKPILAELIALEWRNLPNLSIKPHQVPLTSITARAIDLKLANNADAEGKAKIGNRQHISEELLRYLDTDTLLIFSPADEFEGALRAEQDKLYKPLMSEVEELLTSLHPEKEEIKLSFLDCEVHGIRSNKQSEATKIAAQKFMDSLDVYSFVAFEKAVMSSKSFICGMYTVMLSREADGQMRLELDNIIRASNLETIYQTERWGEVEDTHDVDKEDIKRNLTSAVLLAHGST
ncbi:ATP synthase complex assembly protein [Saccharomycopsis crataegensis]|uniref:ATP synthase complex assembly protein n=1 Tax=Saccharomycopsis crataegensis TaxID=43959 RepID=A0AAV5QRB7_9ASCO|nr:ATP synthase complex assembly protein [Saccharomycopsis crataegensis]